MPTYELRCEECGERFELFRTRLIRDEEKVCPECGSSSVKTGVGGGAYLPKTADVRGVGCGSGGFA